MKILCVGDSNTYGYDPRSYIGDRYPAEVRWADRLAGHEVINRGVNGMTVLRAQAYYSNIIEKGSFDLVIVMLGTNDILTGSDSEETCERMQALLDFISESGQSVLLISPPHLKEGEWVQSGEEIAESEKLGSAYRMLADEKNCKFADASEWNIDLTYDGVHFSEKGHETFAERLERML